LTDGRRFIALIALVGLAWIAPSLAQAPAGVQDETWLHGTWWYATADGDILEGKDKDGMVLKPDGTVDLVNESGQPYLRCTYIYSSNKVLRVDCIVSGQRRALRFLVDATRTRLSGVEDPDKGFYTRMR